MFGSFWKFEKSDFEYALGQITARSLSEERSLALSLAFRLYVAGGRDRKQRHKLKKAVTADNTLVEHLSRYLKPPAQDRQHLRKLEASFKRRHDAHKRKQTKYRDNWRTYLQANADKLRNYELQPGQLLDAQNYLLEFLQETNNRSSRWTDGNWKFLIRHFGNEVAPGISRRRDPILARIYTKAAVRRGSGKYNPVRSDVGFVWSPDRGDELLKLVQRPEPARSRTRMSVRIVRAQWIPVMVPDTLRGTLCDLEILSFNGGPLRVVG